MAITTMVASMFRPNPIVMNGQRAVNKSGVGLLYNTGVLAKEVRHIGERLPRCTKVITIGVNRCFNFPLRPLCTSTCLILRARSVYREFPSCFFSLISAANWGRYCSWDSSSSPFSSAYGFFRAESVCHFPCRSTYSKCSISSS